MNQSDIRSISWDDLRILLETSRGGSIRSGAKRLLMSHATVSRHLAELRERLGVRFFDRDNRELRATPAGSQLIDAAERIEAEVNRVQRNVVGEDFQLRGTVRVALASSTLRGLASAVSSLSQTYPEISLEFSTGVELTNLTRREADIAVRLTDKPPETLVGRNVGTYEVAPYASLEVASEVSGSAPDQMPWVNWDERYRSYDSPTWLSNNVPRSAVRATADTEVALVDLVRAGVGVGFMPCVLAKLEPSLRRVESAGPVFRSSIWVLTHQDLRDTGRVRAVMRTLGDTVRANRDSFLVG